jgi:hypothetical protein
MKAYGRVEVSDQLHSPAALPRERAPCPHWIGGCVDPRAGMDRIEKRKLLPLPGLEIRPSVLQPLAGSYID